MQLDINKLYEKYLTLHIPNPFTLDQIGARLIKQYAAKQITKEKFIELYDPSFPEDPYADFHTVVTVYIFRDQEGMKKLLTLDSPDEKISFYKNINRPYSHGCNLILNSDDQVYMSGGTTQIGTNLLSLETSIFRGFNEEDAVLGNVRFESYLKALYLVGYIQFENDSLIEKARQRYREGYMLQRFGTQIGNNTKFL
ncbi:hypothetical protein [Paenibacillus popilliae]|uniref:Uncharacterized conserved protein n=1 Tax=Paenibacillus popilliae ATCC 14706 TaxID=1212764 RepID=M9LM61_PAEPP|nr:hypothetical protein [Paenibacillus popilliae]GAC44445.1 uncharacterized conserved protein [Paenibacillus popilliae ATCC 14706]